MFRLAVALQDFFFCEYEINKNDIVSNIKTYNNIIFLFIELLYKIIFTFALMLFETKTVLM